MFMYASDKLVENLSGAFFPLRVLNKATERERERVREEKNNINNASKAINRIKMAKTVVVVTVVGG